MRKIRRILFALAFISLICEAISGRAIAATIKEESATVCVSSKTYATATSKKNGWKKEEGKWYYYTGGKKAIGWKKIGGKWYYFAKSGAMQTGWVKSGAWYFMNSSGAMATGWKKTGGKWYYLNSNGAMTTGWKKLGGKWYYLNGSGAMATGWKKLGSTWYYLNSSGVMVTGKQTIKGKTEVFNSSGVWLRTEKTKAAIEVKNGWKKESGKWYYYKNNKKQTGWLKDGGSWYYLNSKGVMLTGTQTIGNEKHQFKSNGVWVKELHTHQWKKKTKTVHHDEVGHWETKTVVDKPAWDEKVPGKIVGYNAEVYCTVCGKHFTARGNTEAAAWNNATKAWEAHVTKNQCSQSQDDNWY